MYHPTLSCVFRSQPISQYNILQHILLTFVFAKADRMHWNTLQKGTVLQSTRNCVEQRQRQSEGELPH